MPATNKVLLRRVYPIFEAVHLDKPIPPEDYAWADKHFMIGVSVDGKKERCVPAYLRPLYTIALGLEEDYDDIHNSTLEFVHRRLCGNCQDTQITDLAEVVRASYLKGHDFEQLKKCLAETAEQLQSQQKPRKMIDTDAVKPIVSTRHAVHKFAGKKLLKRSAGKKPKPPSMSSFLRGKQSAGTAPKTKRRTFDPIDAEGSINQAVHKDALKNRGHRNACHDNFAAGLRPE
jgi:hypothetical protein